jgi:hypothetical protein
VLARRVQREGPCVSAQLIISAAFAGGLAVLPLSTTKAQYYPPCSPFPLFWPFCAARAVVGTAAMIVAAPVRALTGAPPYFHGGYYATRLPAAGPLRAGVFGAAILL